MNNHQDSALFRNKAWLIVGDFNEILVGDESSGFTDFGRIPVGMRDFQRMVLHCNLSDMDIKVRYSPGATKKTG